MKSIYQSCVRSYKELKNLRSLTGLSMLLALSILLTYFFRIDLGPSLSIGLAYIATALMGMLYGPVAVGLANGMGDIIKFILRPRGGYFFGYTFNAILAGAIYGLFFYRQKPTLWRVVAAKTLVNLLVNVLLGTLWMSMLGGKAFFVLVPARLVKNLAMLPIECAILFVCLRAIYPVAQRAGLLRRQA